MLRRRGEKKRTETEETRRKDLLKPLANDSELIVNSSVLTEGGLL